MRERFDWQLRAPASGVLLSESLPLAGARSYHGMFRKNDVHRFRSASTLLAARLRLVLGLGGIVIRIGRRHLRSDFTAPTIETCAQFTRLVRFAGRQVVLLADVFAEIIEFNRFSVVEFDQLEIAHADRAVRHGAALLVEL